MNSKPAQAIQQAPGHASSGKHKTSLLIKIESKACPSGTDFQPCHWEGNKGESEVHSRPGLQDSSKPHWANKEDPVSKQKLSLQKDQKRRKEQMVTKPAM